MATMCRPAAMAALLCFSSVSLCQSFSCSTSLTPTHSIRPSVASGYLVALVATGLTAPRSLQFDSNGNLLVVESGKGISAHALSNGDGTCVTMKSSIMVLNDTRLNHGIALSPDGLTLYASTTEAAYAWDYNADARSVNTTNRTLVTGMSTEDHTSRTLLQTKWSPDMLVISRGSTSNVDAEAESPGSGHSQIRAFNLTGMTSVPYSYDTDGIRLGWGLRNSVGVAEHPQTGGIYSVENSVDQLNRSGVDVHQDNPGEEMNFHGYLNGTEYARQGSNYGYPHCFAAWRPSNLSGNSELTVGSQFAMDDRNSAIDDTYCAGTTPPRLTFQAHTAPLDIKFNNTGTEAWIAYHGSWDRDNPVGYKVSLVQFANGAPVASADSNTSATDIFSNADLAACPGNCFRPVGLAFDSRGRMFVSSDASGEIYVVVRGSASSSANASSTGSALTATTASASEAVKGTGVKAVTMLAVCLGVSFLLLR